MALCRGSSSRGGSSAGPAEVRRGDSTVRREATGRRGDSCSSSAAVAMLVVRPRPPAGDGEPSCGCLEDEGFLAELTGGEGTSVMGE